MIAPVANLTKDSDRASIEREAGNKGRFLFELSSRGVAVPAWSILGAQAFAYHRRKAGLDRVIDERLRDFQTDAADRVAGEIARAIEEAELDGALQDALRRALAVVGDEALAVRSSGVEEDSATLSFAGQFDSFLGVRGWEAIVTAVKKCWASAYSKRSLLYRHQHALGFGGIEIAVVLQRLVHAQTSGVAFTVNPTTGNPFEVVVSAVYGLGEGLVSGAVDADVFTLDKYSGETRRTSIGEKQQRFTAEGVVDVPPEARATACITPEQADAVRREALKIEEAFGRPQDVEWCFAEEKLWILQARPVTGVSASRSTHFDIWDNSNIIENYPGITAPLTFTIARHVYGRVFTEYCRLLWLPHRHLAQMEEFLESLLGYANGRVYYNLLNWYRLVGVNPMQKLGRQTMEVQMGVTEPLDQDELAERLRPYHPASKVEEVALRLVSNARFFWMFARSEAYVQDFKRRFDEHFRRYDGIDYGRLTPDAIFRHYKRFERETVALWGPTVSLESAIGLPYGLLRILARRWIPNAPPWFEAAMIGSVGDVESALPARCMRELAALVRSDPELAAVVEATPSRDLYARLRDGRHKEAAARVDAYLRDFGYRANNELKLEEPDLREDPSLLFDMLKAALATSSTGSASPGAAYEAKAREIVEQNLSGPQRAVFDRLRSLARGAVRRRETVRFARTRMFGVLRNMCRAMGRGLAAQGMFEDPKDVFLLRREELDGVFDAGTSSRELRQIVAQRKTDMASYAKMRELPPRFVTHGSIGLWLRWFEAGAPADESEAADDGSRTLRGTACCPGLATGTARVVKEPNEFLGGVLVTYRTDPGWIAAFPSAKALLIERGSPLTHAAIVARELGIPTIVQIPGLTRRVKTGMEVSVDGDRGVIELNDTAVRAAE